MRRNPKFFGNEIVAVGRAIGGGGVKLGHLRDRLFPPSRVSVSVSVCVCVCVWEREEATLELISMMSKRKRTSRGGRDVAE